MAKMAIDVKSFSVARVVSHVRTPLYRNAYALILSSATTSGLGIVYWMLAARYYLTRDVGLNSAMITTMIFLSGLSQLNLKSALIRFIPVAGRATGRLVGYAYLISVVVTALAIPVFILGLNLWAPADSFLSASAPLTVWFAVGAMTWCIFVLQDSALTGLGQTVWVPIENTIFGVAKIILLIIFAASSQPYGIFASWTIPTVAMLLPINLLIFRRFIPKHVAATESRASAIAPKQIVKFVAGDYLGSLFVEMSISLLPLLVLSQAGASANAYFYLAWIIAYSLQLVAMGMTTSLTVEGAGDQTKLGGHSRRMLLHLLRLLVPMVLIVSIGAPYLLRIFGPDYAAEGATLLRLLALSAIPYSINALYLSFARVQRKIAGIVLVQGALCGLALGLSYVLLLSYGITGIGVAWLASQTLVAVVLMLTQLRPILRPVGPQERRSSI